jgi:hypothetical protein
MTNGMSTGETPNISKAEVISALHKMKESGVENPYAATTAIAAQTQDLLDQWYAQVDAAATAKGNEVAILEAGLEKNTILVEGGYNDEEMKGQAIEWLYNDLDEASAMGKKGAKVFKKIAEKIIALDGGKLHEEYQKKYNRLK